MTIHEIPTLPSTAIEGSGTSQPVLGFLRRFASAYVAAYSPRNAAGHVVDASRLLCVPPPA